MLTVGEILKKTREKQNLSLSEVEKNIKVREKFLRAVEANDWSLFSSKIYINGIIKNYVRFLGLDEKKILAFFRRDYEKKEETKFKKRVASHYLTPESKKYLIIVFIVSILLIFSYFVYQLKVFLSPPSFNLVSPAKVKFTVEKKINIVGKTEKDTSIFIGGDKIYQNKDGIFEYELPLKEGKNELIIELVGANGKKTKVEKVFYKNSPK